MIAYGHLVVLECGKMGVRYGSGGVVNGRKG